MTYRGGEKRGLLPDARTSGIALLCCLLVLPAPANSIRCAAAFRTDAPTEDIKSESANAVAVCSASRNSLRHKNFAAVMAKRGVRTCQHSLAFFNSPRASGHDSTRGVAAGLVLPLRC